MEQAIKIAIENGYTIQGKSGKELEVLLLNPLASRELNALDPLFWQALGKGLGWKPKPESELRGQCKDGCMAWRFDDVSGGYCFKHGNQWLPDEIKFENLEWQYHALRYFETVLTGGDVEAFWKDLLVK